MRPFIRPEDCNQDVAYQSAWWELYAPQLGHVSWESGIKDVDVADVVSKCSVVLPGAKGVRVSLKPHQDGECLTEGFVSLHTIARRSRSPLGDLCIILG